MASQKETRGWGWAILLSTGGISLAFNIGHALNPTDKPTGHQHHDTGSVPVPLAVLYGVAPVLVAMMLSHLIALKGGEWYKKLPTIGVFLAALGLSVRSIHDVLEPIAGPWGYLFAGMLDVASLLALNEILGAGEETDERTEETGSQDRLETGSQELWKPIQETGTEPHQRTGQRTAPETVSEPVSEPIGTVAEQRIPAPTPTTENRPETVRANRPETGSLTGSQGRQNTGSANRPETASANRQKTGSQDRKRTAPKRRGKTRDELIAELYETHLTEHGRPISADKLVALVREQGHGLSKPTALQILADLNSPPKLTAVK